MKERKEKSEEAAREAGIYRVTLVGSVVNLLLLVFKFVAGILGTVPPCWPMPSIRCPTL